MTDKTDTRSCLCLSIRHQMTSLINYLLYFSSLPNSSVEVAGIFKLHLKLFKFSLGVIYHYYQRNKTSEKLCDSHFQASSLCCLNCNCSSLNARMVYFLELKTVKQSLELMHGRSFFNSRYIFFLHLRRRTVHIFKKKFQ